MKCDQFKIMMMDDLYDEIEAQDKVHLDNHLAACPNCRQEYLALKQTSQTLQESTDVDPKMNLVFMHERKTWWEPVSDWWQRRPVRLSYAFAAGVAVVFFVMATFNTEITYQHGNLSAKMSLWPRTSQNQLDRTEVENALAQLRQENIQLTQTLIQQSEARQQQQLASSLIEFSNDIEAKRNTDLQMVGAGIGQVERNIYNRVEQQTSTQYNDLIKLINAQQPRQR
ncbi:zf-HC2 domain-containing protein [candidate division KSB1 bacterium]|nr:zf-HC2 domain-containing protein [candidate division KSB1 bacterium]